MHIMTQCGVVHYLQNIPWQFSVLSVITRGILAYLKGQWLGYGQYFSLKHCSRVWGNNSGDVFCDVWQRSNQIKSILLIKPKIASSILRPLIQVRKNLPCRWRKKDPFNWVKKKKKKMEEPQEESQRSDNSSKMDGYAIDVACTENNKQITVYMLHWQNSWYKW